MKLTEATEALERVGLGRYEALVFLNLSRAGAATAREVARVSGVNRVQTYRALDGLEARGLVEVTLDRPRRYAARALNDVFDMIAEEKRSELERMDEVRKTLLEAWPRLSGRTRARPSVRVQVIKGRGQIYRTIREFVAGAQGESPRFPTSNGLPPSL